MRTIEEIKKQITTCKWFIQSHKEQMNIYLNDDFDIDCLLSYSEKIKILEVEIELLQWVLGEK